MLERRDQRSNDQKVATQLQLEQVISDFDLESCFLIDTKGTILNQAGSIAASALESIAPGVPVVAHAGGDCEDRIYACEFRAGGQKLFIATVGAHESMRTVGAYRALLGIRRIRREPHRASPSASQP